ncbi:neuropeptide-like precursor 1 [Harmonia axyridis]|uniref:neuropeptide-like precursor 1 n=1 Tax=Harmonia axyridis TaxID=115357 RepID=UPI001E277314|nr:neuropeptide-like precursor 1 [Harmonia axyridis]
MVSRFPLKLLLVFLSVYVCMVQSDEPCNLDFERTLQTLFAPQEQPSPQIRSLRRYFISILHSMVARAEEAEGWNTYVYPKRSLEALARAGYLHTLPDEEDNQTDSNDKRSLSALAKNGQLPVHRLRDEESFKRSGTPVSTNDINKEMQKMLDDLYNNLAQVETTKRNIASIARDGGFLGKRNVAALLKNDRYLSNMLNGKRNIASVKASYKPRYKREMNDLDYYEDEDYQNLQNIDRYEKLVEEILEGQQQPQKRFLGSIARNGWYNSPRSSSIRSTSNTGKRHIGSLARLGWLPTIRNVRRFSRSGRSSSGRCREASSDGQDEDYFLTDNTVDNKRFLPVPAMWKVPLQTFNY